MEGEVVEVDEFPFSSVATLRVSLYSTEVEYEVEGRWPRHPSIWYTIPHHEYIRNCKIWSSD